MARSNTFPTAYPAVRSGVPVKHRCARILRLAALVNEQPDTWTRAMLAARFAVSERGIDRDLEVLRGIGYTITRPQAGGYTITVDGGLPGPPHPKD